jgi:uncharacterized membrane protein YhaH (DUF805 family)
MSDGWYYADRSERIGPVSAEAVRAALARFPNAASVYVWRAGFTDWKRAGDVPELWAGAPPPLPFPQVGAVAGGYAQGGVGLFGQAPVDLYEPPTPVQIWFGFSGRSNRAKAWLVVLVNFAVGLVLQALAYVTGMVGAVIFGLMGIALIVSNVAITVTRVHDHDWSGWWSLIFYVVPVILASSIGMTAAMGAASTAGQVVILIGFLIFLGIFIWAFVFLGCLRGTVGDNRFGPDPLGGQR